VREAPRAAPRVVPGLAPECDRLTTAGVDGRRRAFYAFRTGPRSDGPATWISRQGLTELERVHADQTRNLQ